MDMIRMDTVKDVCQVNSDIKQIRWKLEKLNNTEIDRSWRYCLIKPIKYF